MSAHVSPPRSTDVTDQTIGIEWDAVSGASQYIVEVAGFDGDFDQILLSKAFPSSATKSVIDGLQPASAYSFRLVATMDDGSRLVSEPLQCDTAVGSCGPKCSIV